VVLQPQKGTDTIEMVVIGYGTQKKSTEPYPRVVIDTLEPAEGFINFDDYIARNIKMPEEFKAKTTSGEVQLSFDVDKNGQPVNIAIVKSLCSKCDEEAIRLLKEGPKWKKKKNQKGKITIKF
jgi:TonB family protein